MRNKDGNINAAGWVAASLGLYALNEMFHEFTEKNRQQQINDIMENEFLTEEEKEDAYYKLR